jgi:hypothetical protein
MAGGIFSSQFSTLSKLVVQNMDWRYFQLSAVVSGMYLFNIVAISLTGGRVALMSSTLTKVITSYPLLTLIYVTALFEMLDLKIVVGTVVARIRKKSN